MAYTSPCDRVCTLLPLMNFLGSSARMSNTRVFNCYVTCGIYAIKHLLQMHIATQHIANVTIFNNKTRSLLLFFKKSWNIYLRNCFDTKILTKTTFRFVFFCQFIISRTYRTKQPVRDYPSTKCRKSTRTELFFILMYYPLSRNIRQAAGEKAVVIEYIFRRQAAFIKRRKRIGLLPQLLLAIINPVCTTCRQHIVQFGIGNRSYLFLL